MPTGQDGDSPGARHVTSDAAPAGRTWARRMLGRLPTVLWLTVMWGLLWGDFSPGTVIAGAVVASGCYAVAKLPHIPVKLRFSPVPALRLAAYIAFDLVASSVHVAVHVLWRPSRVRGAIVAVPMRTDSDLLLAMVSGGLSLITGSLVIELNRDRGVVYVHGIPIHSPQSVGRLRRQIQRTEEQFVRAFGTPDDIAQFEAAEREFAALPDTSDPNTGGTTQGPTDTPDGRGEQ
ncbi:multisubunit sodium/proton antiporter MrpE subunit [Haloactinospora alba]|uniref:Multisubunit sodium/proton antiporter MrpE subunit n=1 Tax=Haloactinospora alba TaxID=405555 RepID=A0A543NK92_9ACTN|nr:Na+/H+ antiporter subunit E [Haloactinospora alba]TQN32285.1 multisubunit sodium/proton antiporter MrpE subunit [Haloactinospora alba]